MAFYPKEIDDFARFYGFHYDKIEPRSLLREFRIAMERGLRGENSSLPMIPSYINAAVSAPAGKAVVALDAGGTNLRVSRIRFDSDGKPLALLTERRPMPGTQGRLSALEFFDELAAACAPCFEGEGAVEGIGFCFSYEMEVTESGDGIPVALSKEVDAPEIVGKSLGAGLREALLRRGIKAPERIVFLNDTTATLLSGAVQIPVGKYDGAADAVASPVIGFILGTGINTAYPESSIPKIGFDSACAPQIVVAESGGWDFPWLGALDRGFDATTKLPGYHTLEKAASGAYLGQLSLFILKQALREKLISFARQDELLALEKLETRDLNDFLQDPFCLSGVLGGLFAQNERESLEKVLYLESILTERAALLAAGLVAGTIDHIGAGFSPFCPVRIAVEGTTFERYHHIRGSFQSRLHELLCRKCPRFYIVSTVEQASLFGAAAAATS